MRCAFFMLLIGCGQMQSVDLMQPIPEDETVLHAWLVDGQYLDWYTEASVTVGENGAPRRLFANSSLVESFTDERFADDSAAVREMYETDGETFRGLSFMHKRTDGWYFYETFNLTDSSKTSVSEIEPIACVRCHSAGRDLVQSNRSFYELENSNVEK